MNLLFGLILGLFALVHSSPFNAVTQIPAKGEDDVLREAVTDGFLIDYLYDLTTTESPKINTTAQVTQHPPENEDERSGTATYQPGAFETSGEEGSGELTTTVEASSEQPTSTPPSSAVDPSTLSPDLVSPFSPGLGSGDGEIFGSSPDTPISTTFIPNHDSTEQYTSVSSNSTVTLDAHNAPRMFEETEESGSGVLMEATIDEEKRDKIAKVAETDRLAHVPVQGPEPNTESSKGQTGTPGWIIIVGFVVGLAAMIVLFVAIATRDKWNGPSQASQATDLNTKNQPREQEMETFLHKQTPRENGQSSEYTVIPLEELPEKESLD